MEEKKRVDIEVSIEALAWAASQATKLGISRRQFLTRLIERMYYVQHSNRSVDVSKYYPLTPDECVEPNTKNND